MLLRASRNSSELTRRGMSKEAFSPRLAVKAVGKGLKSFGKGVVSAPGKAVRAVKDPLGTIGKTVAKHPMGSLAVVGGTAAAASGIHQGIQKSEAGLRSPYPNVGRPGGYPV